MSSPKAARLQKVFPVDLEKFLPERVLKNYGKWVERRFHGSGIIEHISETGDRIFTVKVGMPPNARVSADTLDRLADVADELGIGAMRVTMAGNLEILTDSLDKAFKIKEAVEKMGFPVGGWGGSLWGINSCTAFLTCTTAVVDSPSITKALGDALAPYFKEQSLPAKLRIFVSGCPAMCAGGTAIDIAIVGQWGAPPRIREDVIGMCLPPPRALAKVQEGQIFLVQVCPTGALTLRREGDKVRLVLVGEKCINCARCKENCDAFDYEPENVGVAILVGGKMSNTGGGARLARVLVPWLPATPPRYEEVVAVVKHIIEVWRQHANPGERMADFIDRIGWTKFLELVGLKEMHEYYQKTPEFARTFLTFRGRGEIYRRLRDVL